MITKITKVKFLKENDGKYGKFYSFLVEHANGKGFYSSKSKEQTKFIEGKEAEFTEEKRTGKTGEYTIIKPIIANKWNRNAEREKTKYSGFSVSYAKDLVIAGKIELKDLPTYATVLHELMIQLDKND